jgi:hypothetical protein
VTPLSWVLDDGGRAAAGRRGNAGDCVARAVAIASGLPYLEVYEALRRECRRERRGAGRSSPRWGIHRRTYERYVVGALGATWTPTMGIGTGCTHHLRHGEVPARGRLVVVLARHLAAVINGVVRDTHDPGHGGTRCVYGWYDLSEFFRRRMSDPHRILQTTVATRASRPNPKRRFS